MINTLEPANDPDRLETRDGTTIGVSNNLNTKTPRTLQKFYNMLREAPLRKLLAMVTYIVDIVIVFLGFAFKRDLPTEIAAGWNVTRVTIYAGYFGSSAVESVVTAKKLVSKVCEPLIPQNTPQQDQPAQPDVIGTTPDGTPIIQDKDNAEES